MYTYMYIYIYILLQIFVHICVKEASGGLRVAAVWLPHPARSKLVNPVHVYLHTHVYVYVYIHVYIRIFAYISICTDKATWPT